jgi:diketogulonate reductase-like aldo/keto reductase
MHCVNANGANIPAIGLGTWTLKDAAATRLVASAVRSGYRHVDTAAMYANEEAVGAGLRASGVPRDEIFLTTKVWPSDIGGGDLQRSVEASLKRLQVDRVDLALIHWPSSTVPLAESIEALSGGGPVAPSAGLQSDRVPSVPEPGPGSGGLPPARHGGYFVLSFGAGHRTIS